MLLLLLAGASATAVSTPVVLARAFGGDDLGVLSRKRGGDDLGLVQSHGSDDLGTITRRRGGDGGE